MFWWFQSLVSPHEVFSAPSTEPTCAGTAQPTGATAGTGAGAGVRISMDFTKKHGHFMGISMWIFLKHGDNKKWTMGRSWICNQWWPTGSGFDNFVFVLDEVIFGMMIPAYKDMFQGDGETTNQYKHLVPVVIGISNLFPSTADLRFTWS